MRATTRHSAPWLRRRRWLGYLVASLALAATIPLRFGLERVTDHHAMPLVFIIPVALAAYTGGLGPTIAATLGGAMIEVTLFADRFGWDIVGVGDEIRITLFVAAGVLLSITSESMHQARSRAESVRRRLEDEIDARRRADQALYQRTAEAEQRATEADRARNTLQAVFENFPEGILVTGGAPDFRILLRPRQGDEPLIRAVSSRGHDDSQTAGETLLYADREAIVPRNRVPLYRAVRLGEHVRDEEFRVRRADGSLATLLVDAVPIRGDREEVVGAVAVWRDISARKAAELRIAELNERLQDTLLEARRSEYELRFVMDAMPQKVFTATADGEVDYVNPQWVEYTGLSVEEIGRGSWIEAIHGGDRREGALRWARAMRSGEPFVFEHRIRRADGEYRWHISRAVARRDAQGRIELWVGSSTDVHELKSAQHALRAAHRVKDEFLATLAHELRNPLAPLVSSIEILNQSADAPAAAKARATIERQTAHLVRLVDDLLDVSRMTQNLLQIRKQNVTLGAVLNPALETVRPAIAAAQQHLTVSLPSPSIQLHADPVRLTQVFANLLGNASKYTPRAGTIDISAEVDEGWLVARIRDSGIGIAPERLVSVFEPFARIDQKVGEQRPQGLGIGLSLVRRVVDLHGGSVTAHSAGEGSGSEFVVRLPVLSAPPLERDSRQRDRGVAPGHPRRILIADDNMDAAEALETLLTLSGAEIRVVHDGLDAVRVAREFRPDAVILDIGMPKLDGYEAAARLRSARWAEGSKMRLIALTGWGQKKDRERTRAAGFDTHLVKPVSYAALLEALGDGSPPPSAKELPHQRHDSDDKQEV
ncbi:MAG: ATP-binding protein [Gemmatimonadaceae bacterium]